MQLPNDMKLHENFAAIHYGITRERATEYLVKSQMAKPEDKKLRAYYLERARYWAEQARWHFNNM
jgi:hypothetical protein